MTVTVTPFEKGFGAEIADIDLTRPIGDEDRDAVYGAFLEHHLIIIRGQALTAEQIAAARKYVRFGSKADLFHACPKGLLSGVKRT